MEGKPPHYLYISSNYKCARDQGQCVYSHSMFLFGVLVVDLSGVMVGILVQRSKFSVGFGGAASVASVGVLLWHSKINVSLRSLKVGVLCRFLLRRSEMCLRRQQQLFRRFAVVGLASCFGVWGSMCLGAAAVALQRLSSVIRLLTSGKCLGATTALFCNVLCIRSFGVCNDNNSSLLRHPASGISWREKCVCARLAVSFILELDLALRGATSYGASSEPEEVGGWGGGVSRSNIVAASTLDSSPLTSSTAQILQGFAIVATPVYSRSLSHLWHVLTYTLTRLHSYKIHGRPSAILHSSGAGG
jgi:hypothetical protein